MKKIIMILVFLPILVQASQDIYADERLEGADLIEIVHREGQEVNSNSATTEKYKATIECTHDKLNPRLSYCTIDE